MSAYPKCTDCGFDFPADEHAQSVVMTDRLGAYVLCARCWIKRGPEERGEIRAQQQPEQRA